jgi:hypothetical protein
MGFVSPQGSLAHVVVPRVGRRRRITGQAVGTEGNRLAL